MNTTNTCNITIGWQFVVLIFREHAIFKFNLAIIEKQFQAITRKELFLFAIAVVIFFSSTFFNTLDLCK